MVTATLRRLGSGFLPVVVLSVLLLISLYLMSNATQNSEEFGRIFFGLLFINIVALLILMVLIGANLVRLIRQYRNRATGSRLTVRLVIMFIILALLPVSVVFYFSLGFIQRSIDSWFDIKIEKTLDNTLELTRLALDERKRDLITRSTKISQYLLHVPQEGLAAAVVSLRQQYDAQDLAVLDKGGRVLAFSSADINELVPELPDAMMLQQLQQQGSYLERDEWGKGKLALRILLTIPGGESTNDWILQARYPLSDRVDELTENIQVAFAEYHQLTLLREPLKFSFTLTLSLVLLLSCLTAVWAAFFSARRLVAPIRALAIGTRAVAAGDYHRQLPQHSHDELGFLVQSFNDMTRRLALARDEADSSRLQAERERAYLRVVLGRLSSGVLTLDRNHTIRTANVSSGHILGVELRDYIDRPLEDLLSGYDWLENFVNAITPHLDSDEKEWREDIVVPARHGRRVLTCGGAALPEVGGRQAGHVIVFEDVTTLVQAQRDAAWGEVARRLAHEIKNPLTPIQLSAERLRQKYLDKMSASDAEMLDRLTHTIVQQVEVMKTMVQAFSEYAHVPQLQMTRIALNDVVGEVLDLYRSSRRPVNIETDLAADIPLIEADSGRIRQLLHNLIKNAFEAIGDRHDGWIRVSTGLQTTNGYSKIRLRIEDNGSGISDELLAQVFEPYVSSKIKGSGLGLAIVKKIVEEHGGAVHVYNRSEEGACVDVLFPVVESEQAADRQSAAEAEDGTYNTTRVYDRVEK